MCDALKPLEILSNNFVIFLLHVMVSFDVHMISHKHTLTIAASRELCKNVAFQTNKTRQALDKCQ